MRKHRSKNSRCEEKRQKAKGGHNVAALGQTLLSELPLAA
jgi:hypothetical protein